MRKLTKKKDDIREYNKRERQLKRNITREANDEKAE